MVKDNIAFMKSVVLWEHVYWLAEDPLIETLSTGGYINTKLEGDEESSSRVRPSVAGVC